MPIPNNEGEETVLPAETILREDHETNEGNALAQDVTNE